MTEEFEVATGKRFEVDSRGQLKYESPFPASWGAVPADEEARVAWIAHHVALLPLTGKRALAELELKKETPS